MSEAPTEIPSIAIYVCTHRRNEELDAALASIVASARRAAGVVRAGMVVVDDNPDGSARIVADRYAEAGLPLGCTYRHSGRQNISLARNLGIETAMAIADWVGMVDDDEVVEEQWLEQLFAVQARTGADAVTGPVHVEYSSTAPAWLHEQDIGAIFGAPLVDDASHVEHCSTGNSMISTSWLEANPTHRFRTDLGTTGGEDMVFYRSAIAAGLKAYYARDAVARETAGPARSTQRYVFRRAMWMGNTTAVTNLETGAATRVRLGLRVGKLTVLAATRPFQRVISGSPPQLRHSFVVLLHAAGMLAGLFGRRLEHS